MKLRQSDSGGGLAKAGFANRRMPGWPGWVVAVSGTTRDSNWLCMPFDMVRQQHAHLVWTGLMPASLLSSARLERMLDCAERWTLGPLARRR